MPLIENESIENSVIKRSHKSLRMIESNVTPEEALFQEELVRRTCPAMLTSGSGGSNDRSRLATNAMYEPRNQFQRQLLDTE